MQGKTYGAMEKTLQMETSMCIRLFTINVKSRIIMPEAADKKSTVKMQYVNENRK